MSKRKIDQGNANSKLMPSVAMNSAKYKGCLTNLYGPSLTKSRACGSMLKARPNQKATKVEAKVPEIEMAADKKAMTGESSALGSPRITSGQKIEMTPMALGKYPLRERMAGCRIK